MKSTYLCVMVEGHWIHTPWHYFIPKLKITIFSNIVKIGLLSEVKNVLFVINTAYYAMKSI